MIAIIKYNAGNIRSVQNALKRLGCESIITDQHEEIKNADHVIFPGVGEAASAMNYLQKNELDILIKSLTQPVLGICLGLQLMSIFSEEGNTDCLGIFETQVKKFPPQDKVPHTGWNNFTMLNDSLLLKGINIKTDMYYVHSYYAELCKDTQAACEYIIPFSAVMQRDNFFATQFHPEKSGEVGEGILKNFLNITQ